MDNNIKNNSFILTPSLICLNMLKLKEQIAILEGLGVTSIHIDILDGYFSPSMPLGFEIVSQLRKITQMDFNCHVMAESPEWFVDKLLNIGVQEIIFHVETAKHIDAMINHIHSFGVHAGLALKPSTSLSVLDYELEKCDAILLMQINPGYASDKNEGKVPYAGRKIQELRQMVNKRNLNTKIIIDGRVSVCDIESYGKGIVDEFVIGSTCMEKNHLNESIMRLNRLREMICS